MLRRVLLGIAALFAAAVAFAALGLWLDKRAINAINPTLPSVDEVLAFDPDADLPVRLSWLDTATQPMPRADVLEPSLDATPNAPYVMSYPAFVFEWADGRIFLVDLGMEPEFALSFGRPLELMGGAAKIKPIGTVAARLGDALLRVKGVAFTHEHQDHTNGAAELCRLHPGKIPLFQGRLQVDETNYTTRPAQREISAAKCLDRRVMDGSRLLAIPGFPGLSFFAAGGHTPGSQVFVAHVRGTDRVRTWVLVGDLANNIDGVRQNVPKPRYYSLFIVPESTARLDVLRRFLAGLERDHGAGILVSHDELSLEASGLPKL
ncbi:MAG TPA: MBL fold metallo-hydrolase [Myxococcota bacterium]|nr:MBL fold metallo-hydrolase [Myxococcota bacterium]